MWKRFFSRQARKPSGWFGRTVAVRLFDKGNSGLNTLMLDMAAPMRGQCVLEIGFGCGTVIRALADAVADGRVEGIDFSDAMMRVAAKRNRRHITDGRVVLRHGDFDEAAFPAASFDTVCSANTIYFWRDVPATCMRIHRVLKPGGRVVLAFVDKSRMDGMPLDMEVFRSIGCATLRDHLAEAGFSSIEERTVPGQPAQLCVAGTK